MPAPTLYTPQKGSGAGALFLGKRKRRSHAEPSPRNASLALRHGDSRGFLGRLRFLVCAHAVGAPGAAAAPRSDPPCCKPLRRRPPLLVDPQKGSRLQAAGGRVKHPGTKAERGGGLASSNRQRNACRPGNPAQDLPGSSGPFAADAGRPCPDQRSSGLRFRARLP
jgi:hypothetical protein